MDRRAPIDFWFWVAVAVLAVAAGYAWERAAGAAEATCWLALSGAGALYLVFYAWRHLDENRPAPQAPLYRSLGVANWLTLLRGLAAMLMLGFFCPHSATGWAPAVLYSFVALTDWWDGFIARSTGRTSRFGELLDLHLDGLGILIASLLAIALGRLLWWYAFVGLARYAFLGWEWLLRAFGREPKPLPPNPDRRATAGLMMAFLAASFYPIFSPNSLEVIGLWFFVPFIYGFVRDGLSVAGKKLFPSPGTVKGAARRRNAILLRRLAGAIMLIVALWTSSTMTARAAEVAALLVALGVLPRFSALAALTALLLLWSNGTPITPLALLASAFLTYTAFYGGGKACLWNPDERLFVSTVALPRSE